MVLLPDDGLSLIHILTVLTITLDNHLIPSDDEEIARILSAFTEMQERGMGIPSHTLRFLMRKI